MSELPSEQVSSYLDYLPAIYQDENAKLARDMGIPYGYKFHGQVVHYPALILLDKEGNEVLRYVGEHNGDRMSFDDLVARIDALKK